MASQNGNVPLVKVLLKAGANVNQTDTTHGCTPLYIASQNGDVALVKVLLKAGSNINQAKTTNGLSNIIEIVNCICWTIFTTCYRSLSNNIIIFPRYACITSCCSTRIGTFGTTVNIVITRKL